MTAEQRLRALTELVDAAAAQQREKLREYRDLRATVRVNGTYDALHVAEAGLASASDRLEDLRDQHEEALADVQYEWLRDNAPPHSRLNVENEVSLDAMKTTLAREGDADAMNWVQWNLK